MIKTSYVIVDDVAGDSAEIFLANNDVQAMQWFKNTCQKIAVDGTQLSLYKTSFVKVSGDGTKRAIVDIVHQNKLIGRFPSKLEQKLVDDVNEEVKNEHLQ